MRPAAAAIGSPEIPLAPRPMIRPLTTVRDRTFEIMRQHRMTRIFGNPGSTEIPFLTDLPADLEFVLALHEGSVVGIASGYALATGTPAFVNLHTAPGLGHAGNAIAGARDSRAPLVIVVGQQDRAHFGDGSLPHRPRPRPPRRDLSRLDLHPGPAPGSARGRWPGPGTRPRTARGPALVIAPMGDWAEPGGPRRRGRSRSPRSPHERRDPAAAAELADLIEDSRFPGQVDWSGSRRRRSRGVGRRLSHSPSDSAAPVWQKTFRRPGRGSPRIIRCGPGTCTWPPLAPCAPPSSHTIS